MHALQLLETPALSRLTQLRHDPTSCAPLQQLAEHFFKKAHDYQASSRYVGRKHLALWAGEVRRDDFARFRRIASGGFRLRSVGIHDDP